jgi:hypothetical protein
MSHAVMHEAIDASGVAAVPEDKGGSKLVVRTPTYAIHTLAFIGPEWSPPANLGRWMRAWR